MAESDDLRLISLAPDGTLSRDPKDPKDTGTQWRCFGETTHFRASHKRLLECAPDGGKKPKIAYTAEELVRLVKDVGATVPHPDVLVEMWAQSGGDHMGFMARYVKYCEVF